MEGAVWDCPLQRNYARMMDGDITVESAEGKGTVFTVTAKLEFCPPEKGAEGKTENTVLRESGLLVEDHSA